MQRFITIAVLLLLAAGATAACSSRNPVGGGQPSPGTGGGGGGNTDTPAAPSGRHTLSWDGSNLRLRLAATTFTAWKDGGGEVDVDLDHGWSGQYVPFNASDARKNGIAMARSGNELSLRKDGALPWIGGFNVVSGDKFSVKYAGPDGNVGWHKYETTSLSGVEKELDAGSSTSYHFLIPTGSPGII